MSEPERSVQDELRSLSSAAANLQAHLGMVGDTVEKRRAHHVARVDALSDIERRLDALAGRAIPPTSRVIDGVEVHWPPLRGDEQLPLRQRGRVEPRLVAALEALGDPYGAMGVALAAARLVDPVVLTRVLFDDSKTGTVEPVSADREESP